MMWCSGSVMDCHTTARASIPGGNGVKTKLHVLRLNNTILTLYNLLPHQAEYSILN